MGRLLRDRKKAVDAKRTPAQSHLTSRKAKTPSLRQAQSNKTIGNSENESPGKSIRAFFVTTTRSHSRSVLSSPSENYSPPGCDLTGRKAKIQRHGLARKLDCEKDSSGKIILNQNRTKRNALSDKTNSSENESPVKKLVSGRKGKPHIEEDKCLAVENNGLEGNSSAKNTMVMSLRRRKNEKLPAENSFCRKSLPNDLNSFNHKTICSPRAISSSKEQTYSCGLSASNRLSKSFVQLEDISELVKNHVDNKNVHKKPIYQTISDDDIKISTEMLPEEKIKLYEYEVDANSPKKVKVKRKRKPRKKKVHVSESDLSDDESCPVRSVTKRPCTISTPSLLDRKKDDHSSKSNSVVPNQSQVLSPIKSPKRPAGFTPKNVQFTDDVPSANSTPNTSIKLKESVPLKTLRFSQKETSSPIVKTIPRRQIKKSIFINPTEILDRNFSPDLSVASEVNTTENNCTANLTTSPSQSLKQTKINSFFSTSARSGNDTNEVANHNNTGLFCELPSRSNSESMSTTAASATGQFITMRRKAMYHAKPRISGFERTAPEKPLKPMTVENCFGFDDDEAEDSFIPPSTQYRSLPLSVSVRAVCSTPITAPQPTRICVQAVTQPLPKKTAKLASSPQRVLKRLEPLPLLPKELLAASTSEYASHSPPLILSDPETLTPVTFGDEPSNFCKPARRSYQRTPKPRRDYTEAASDDDELLVVAKKPKKKGKQYLRKKKQEVENWASSINRQFEEIDDVDLVVE